MNKKKVMIIVSGIVAVLFVVVAFGIYGVKDYIAKTPKLTLKWVGEVKAGQTLTLQDLVDVECKGDYHLDIAIDTNIDDAKVSNDKQFLYVGSHSGYIKVILSGYGSVAEHVSEENIVYVGLGEQERQDFVKRANGIAESVEKYIKEEYIPEHENYTDMKLVQVIYNCQIEPYRLPWIDSCSLTQLELQYQKPDGSDVYLVAQYSMVNNEEQFDISERDLFVTSIQMFDEANESGQWWMNIGDGIILQKSSDSMSGVPVEAYDMNYMYLID